MKHRIFYKNMMYRRYISVEIEGDRSFVWFEYNNNDDDCLDVFYSGSKYIELENEYNKMLRLEKLERILL